ncbi:polyribonucleotide nucleotidyltransferase 1, mitochondrial isoform X6 [Frankliniella occidentalis]|uniref:polyribonucleotide nucleotidyltransferase n=1 Tax=Frankliniella occidentalis TaxID=133901 RepID=A0A9C6TT36_FRAOC|nr:polyribonucleotide nucleotidyltransferase 1, mitochondrial isoform X5 [Frankliniella occidentalis]XP_052119932.1 polyribonucleotide nucleotidyltransferase 1, mitochondrial isoform X6 [Frankliniella occidentalis]
MASLLRNRLKSVKLKSFHNLSCRAITISSFMCNNKPHEIKETVSLLNGKTLTFSTGKYAKMANGSAVVQSEDTAVMVTAVCKDSHDLQDSFLPLTVEFRMKSAAAGRIPTNYLRRELGQSEREILTARLTDRSIRPLFPKNYLSEVQIMSNLLSADGINDPEVLCINAASTALSLSDIPWDGPVGAVRVGLIGDDIIINPTRHELQKSAMNLVVAGIKSSKVVMVEGSFNDLNLNTVLHSIKAGMKEVKKIVASIEQLTIKCGKTKQEVKEKIFRQELLEYLQLHYLTDLKNIFSDFTLNKQQRDKAVSSLRDSIVKNIKSQSIETVENNINHAFSAFVRNVFRDLIFESNVRCDGRGLNDVRDISCEVNLYKPLHGSSLFQRGQTQVLCTVALDSPQSAVKTDSYTILTSGLKEKSFFLNYEFPGYATNEVKQGRGVSRREIGHGALAEKGLRPVVPADYPFCIRLTSEVLESNGSSSMATVCGGSMALLDAGVPISAMASGVAMGLVTRCQPDGEIEDYRILTDILGIEDYIGDMDFKIAGTKTGITALQADFKIPGISLDILHKVLSEGHTAKRKIINIMSETISSPSVKEENMPILETFEVPVQKRNLLLGPAWINIKKLFLQTGVQITHVEDTTFSAFAPNDAAMQEAYEVVQKILDSNPEPQFEFGAIYSVKIMELKESGAMVSLHPQLMPVFINNSHLDVRKIAHPSAVGLTVGQKISVKYFGRDPVSGQIRLSRRALQESTGRVHDLESLTSHSTQLRKERIVANSECENKNVNLENEK